jgi:signal transduction histidine kinase
MLLRVRGDVLTDETPLLLADKLHPIRSLLTTPDRSLWIGFAGRGLGRLKDGRFTSFRREHGLYDDYVSQILCDGRGRLWLAGNRGISSVRIKDLDESAAGLVQQIHALVYKQKDGLLGLQASYNSWPTAFCDKDGALFFAMQSGVAILYPDAITDDPLPPKVVIDRVLANGEVVALYGAIGEALPGTNAASLFELGQAGAELRLPSGRRQVEFRFTAPAFMMPESIRFKYQLQGLDTEWIEAGAHRSALYSQLAPGRYRFRVIACNLDGVWNEQGASLDVTVPPFWWETVWFRVGGPLVAVGLVGCWLVLGLRRRYRHKLERMELQQATEKERMRISRDLHDDLGAGLTQISLVNALIQKGAADAEKVRGASSKVNEIMSGLVRSLDEIVWAVNPRNDTFDGLVTYLGRYAEEFLKVAGLRCRLDLPLDVPAWPVTAKVRHGLFLAFKETLNNAAKHSAASVVRISVRTQVDGFELLIEDDGQGFKTEQGERAGRSGLANIRNRLAEIGGSCVIESDIGKGTCVRFRMAERAL